MKKLLIIVFVALVGQSACADTVVAARHVRAGSIITADDLELIETNVQGSYAIIEDAVGQEARVVLYAGRPVLTNDIGPPALVERNQIVTLIYTTGSLSIMAEGRSLGRGGFGDRIRVMNLSSRTTIIGSIDVDGSVLVANTHFSNR